MLESRKVNFKNCLDEGSEHKMEELGCGTSLSLLVVIPLLGSDVSSGLV